MPINSLKIFLAMLMVVTLLSGLSACARPQSRSTATDSITVTAPATQNNHYWWYCRYTVDWPENAEPDLAVDLLLAHAVVAPVLKLHKLEIPYWRFHRRAARDDAGHQFSFIFYTDPYTAARIMTELNQSAILQQALTGRILDRINFDDIRNPAKPDLEDASDPGWSIEIQRNWPAYIMGASATWLGLIDDVMHYLPATTDIHELIGQYRQAQLKITALWSTEGQHALLHHLSAIFGYEPLFIQQEIQF